MFLLLLCRFCWSLVYSEPPACAWTDGWTDGGREDKMPVHRQPAPRALAILQNCCPCHPGLQLALIQGKMASNFAVGTLSLVVASLAPGLRGHQVHSQQRDSGFMPAALRGAPGSCPRAPGGLESASHHTRTPVCAHTHTHTHAGHPRGKWAGPTCSAQADWPLRGSINVQTPARVLQLQEPGFPGRCLKSWGGGGCCGGRLCFC